MSTFVTPKNGNMVRMSKICLNQPNVKLSMLNYTMLINVAHWYMPNCQNSLVSQPQPWVHDQGKGLQGCRARGRLGVTSHAPRSAKSVRNEPSHSQMNSHCGSWSPKWTFKWIFKWTLESSEHNCRVKSHLFEKFFMSLESY